LRDRLGARAQSGARGPGSSTRPSASLHGRGLYNLRHDLRSLRIEWADGHVSTYGFEHFRWLCPCAYCRGEAGLPGWLDENPTLTAEQTRLVSIQPVGAYAIAPTWGDGHGTGFYTFTALRAHCPCDTCATVRTAGGHPEPGAAHA
jgi:DUF971 family protein